ncbi:MULTISPECIES: hypothetical protein [Actinosynnema]|uniref:hypothetical protein n=1 Tax=Actinosynnema TaxID=40566 RepID=UPI0020A4722F|nr:hypothetical protein [Actinosynnema pretiosum]
MILARDLLDRVAPLSHSARQRALAMTARDTTPEDLGALLAELHAAGGHPRHVGLSLAAFAGDVDHVVRCLPSIGTPPDEHEQQDRSLTARALVAAVRVGVPAPTVAAVLPALSEHLRHVLHRAIRRRRATDLAEALLPLVRDRFGDVEAAALLAACADATVARLLPGLEHAITGWARLAERHPRAVLGFVAEQPFSRSARHFADAVRAAGPAAPDLALAHVERALDAGVPAKEYRDLRTTLLRHDPTRAVRLFTRFPDLLGWGRCSTAFWRACAAQGADVLAALVRGLRGKHHLAALLAVLPPATCAAFVPDDTESPELLLLLPAAERVERVRALLARATPDDSAHRRLSLTALLPWAEARDALVAATGDPDPDARDNAYELFALAASREPGAFGEVVARFDRLARDRDPVRRRVLTTFGQLPAHTVRAEDAEAWTALLVAAIDAEDSSSATRDAVLELLPRMIGDRVDGALVDAALTVLARLAEVSPDLYVSDLYHPRMAEALPPGLEHRLFEALRPRIEADARRGEHTVLLDLAGELGRRAWVMPALQSMLADATAARDEDAARRATALWLAADPDRVTPLLARDPSAAARPEVLAVVSRRTDLVDEVVAATGDGRPFPLFTGGFHRWTPAQAQSYATALAAAAGDDGALVQERVAAVRVLGLVPGAADLLRPLLDDPDRAVAEAALHGLAAADSPDADAELLARLDGPHALKAARALVRRAALVPPSHLAGLVASLLASDKVGARKTGVRLAAAHRLPGAARLLADQRGWHRDLDVAVVAAAGTLPADEVSWEVLRWALDRRDTADAVLRRAPRRVPPAHRERYARLVLDATRLPDGPTSGEAAGRLRAWSRWLDGGEDLVVDLVVDLSRRSGWWNALLSLAADADALVRVAGRLVALDDVDTDEHDLPVRRRLAALVGRFEHARPTRAASDALVALLAPEHPDLAVDVAVAAVDCADPGAVPDAVRVALRAATTPGLLAEARLKVAKRLGKEYVAHAERGGLVRALLEVDARLAVAVLSTLGTDEIGAPEWRSVLRSLRVDDDPDVRLAARRVFATPR